MYFTDRVLLCPCHAPSCFYSFAAFIAQIGGCVDMARFLYRRHHSFGSIPGGWSILVICWLLGSLAGAACSVSAGEPLASLMYSAMERRVSFVSLLGILILPFLFSVFAVYIHSLGILFVICFLKAFSFSFVFAAVCAAFPDSYWLLRWLLMFSECLVIPVLFWFWLHFLSGKRSGLLLPSVVSAMAILFVAAIDHTYISAFLAELMKL